MGVLRSCPPRRVGELPADHRSGDAARNFVARSRNVRPGLQRVLWSIPRERAVTGSVAVGVALTGPGHLDTGFIVVPPNESLAILCELIAAADSRDGE